MTFAEKLKNIRKKVGMSQEKLAEKLGVSRQAITKWETDAGTPDITNIMAISTLFGISMDELLSDEKPVANQTDFLYESVTEYDIDCPKRYDMKLGGAKRVAVRGYDGEKIRVRLASNTLSTLQSDFKLKIDDVRNRIDLDISRKNGMTEAAAKESLDIMVAVPQKYIGKIELAVNADSMELDNMKCESIELDCKVSKLMINGVEGTVEINCDLDMDITCRSLDGAVEINQRSATSRITVPVDAEFAAIVKGIGTSVSYEKGGKPCEDFSTKGSDNVIELNGMKSELVICTE